MVTVDYSHDFERRIKKIKDAAVKEAVKNQILKITANPEVGKPMKYARKGTRELYVAPFRLSYKYLKQEDKVVILRFYHKDEQ